MKTHINVTTLYAALDAARQERGLSWRSLAKEVGVSPSLLSRMSNGFKPDADGFATLVTWLGLDADDFFISPSDAPEEKRPEPELLVQLAPLLRARSDLTEADVQYLEEVISATVRRARAAR
ncbi:helix-turn-helix domain-containing protein [Pseudarthrobacter sp. NPDC058329]|uniref:helix-turn-helix domain-containing protein n=1 Tax=Pseudarthrobacter sp. NPDC058329 TaxID=3346448 RepID=UPI0036D8C497